MTGQAAMQKRYNDLATHLRAMFGCRVQKISVDAGLSCPNRDGRLSTGGCIYCNARGSGTGAHRAGRSISSQLAAGKLALAHRYGAEKFIAYFQSYSNTYAPLPVLKALYDEALGVPGIVGLSIGTRPDCVSPPVLELIADYARQRLVWVEYGLHSARDETLAHLNRGHNAGCFFKAVALTRNRGIRICAHVILGLPGETRADMLYTADRLADAGIDGLKLHLLYVVKGTPMEALWRTRDYRCLEQQEYVDLACDILERIPPSVVIQRLTGDPHPAELAAPAWCRNKAATLAMIDAELERRNSHQGARAAPAATGPVS
ncbi:MAG: TIGR01212 family radical SAM protein [Desulfobacterales bacterium]